MPTFNFREREVSCKIVYYGPSLSGKTTNIVKVHEKAPQPNRSDLQSVDTAGDRTLFFDHFSLDLGQVGGMRTKFQVYGVPGQPQYRVTRKMVLGGVDGIVFVADSERARMQDNFDSLQDMQALMAEHNYDFFDTPMVIQYNKRDLPDVAPVEELEEQLNDRDCRSFEGVAIEGVGVVETFKTICSLVVAHLNETFEASDASRP